MKAKNYKEKFPFRKVQLILKHMCLRDFELFVSIPQGTINTSGHYRLRTRFVVSIPQGTINTPSPLVSLRRKTMFPFRKVQLIPPAK